MSIKSFFKATFLQSVIIMVKLRVIKAYDAIDTQLKKQLREQYPYGFDKHLIRFSDAKGKITSALPYEAEDKVYLIKMTSALAHTLQSMKVEEEEEEDLEDAVMDIVGEEAELELDAETEEKATS